jgi:hypothetical protein
LWASHEAKFKEQWPKIWAMNLNNKDDNILQAALYYRVGDPLII